MARPIALILLLGLLVAGFSAGAQAPIRSDLTAVDVSTYPWSSVAKLNNSVGQSCTAVVIDQDKVLTAAHCIFNRRTGRFLPPASLHVLLGYERGKYAVHALVDGYTVGSGYDPEKKLATLSSDWTILKLIESLPAAIRPLKLCEGKPSQGDQLVMASYAWGRRHVLTADKECQLLREDQSRLLFENNCMGAQGSSGAPVLIANGVSVCVLGVQVAMEKGANAPRMIAVSAGRIRKETAEARASQK